MNLRQPARWRIGALALFATGQAGAEPLSAVDGLRTTRLDARQSRALAVVYSLIELEPKLTPDRTSVSALSWANGRCPRDNRAPR